MFGWNVEQLLTSQKCNQREAAEQGGAGADAGCAPLFLATTSACERVVRRGTLNQIKPVRLYWSCCKATIKSDDLENFDLTINTDLDFPRPFLSNHRPHIAYATQSKSGSALSLRYTVNIVFVIYRTIDRRPPGRTATVASRASHGRERRTRASRGCWQAA